MYRICSASATQVFIHEYEPETQNSTLVHQIDNLEVRSLHFSPDNTVVACLLAKEVLFLHFKDKILAESIPLPSSDVITCLFGFKSGRYFYMMNADTLFVFDRRERKYLEPTKIAPMAHSMAISADDHRLVFGLNNGKILVYSLKYKTSTIVDTNQSGSIESVAFYPFKKHVIVAGGNDGTVFLIDVITGKILSKKPSIHVAPITGVAFAPCNKHFYCSISLDKQLLFHDIQSTQSNDGILQKCELEWPLHALSINDDHMVAVGDSTGLLWLT